MSNDKTNPASKPKSKHKIRPQLIWGFFGVLVASIAARLYANALAASSGVPTAVVRASYVERPCYRCQGDPKLVANCPVCGGKGIIKIDPSRVHNTNAPRRPMP